MHFQAKRSGQITVLALLLGILGLTIALGVASRSLSDLKQVSVVDSGTKAYAAAEAGVQYALNQIATGSDNGTIDCSSINPVTAPLTLNGISSVTYRICANTSDFISMPAVQPDDVFQVDLSTINPSNVKFVPIVWKNPAAAVEISYLDVNNVIHRYAYNGSSTNPSPANNFSSAAVGSTCVNVASGTQCADHSFDAGNCVATIPFNAGDKLVRVKPLYAATDIAVCGQAAGNSPGRLSIQNSVVTAVATTSSNVTKKIQVTQMPATLPAVFDNVIFAGGNLIK